MGSRMTRLLLLLFLFGCTVESPQETKPITLTLVAQSEIRSHCGVSPLEPYGCAKQKDGGRCEIVAIKPRGFDDHPALETLGHELWHCFHGPIHD